jgi:hypothetical protein
MGPLPFFRISAFVGLVALAVACSAQSDGSGAVVGPSAGYAGTPGGTLGGTPNKPLLVVVDTNVVMTATPGDGVGVFTEYKTGGHWHIWWTCDTNKTTQSCAFDVKVTPSSGAIANARSDQFGTTDSLTATTAAPLEAVTTTSTTAEGVYFDTAAGIAVTLDASVGGLEDGSFLFFVQDGEVNGGYTGVLTDPLMLKGSSP